MRLTVAGAGAWGTALAITFCARHHTTLWARDAHAARRLATIRENQRYLPGCRLPEALNIEADFSAAIAETDLLILAVPLAGLRPLLRRLRDLHYAGPLLWVCKGLESETACLPHQIVNEELAGTGASGDGRYGVLSGPSFAQEVARGLPTALTLAANTLAFAQQTAAALHSPHLRIYANSDLTGAEVGGAVKNVIAIAAGISDGLGFGHNARAALITRGLAEIARLGMALGGQPETFMGLTGMGDLLLTCTGDLSRNRRVGLALAAGKKLPEILADLGHVAEGVNTAQALIRLAERLAVEMPITQAVDAILNHDKSAVDTVAQLLQRNPKTEAL